MEYLLQSIGYIVQVFIFILIVDIWLKLRHTAVPEEEENKEYNSWYGRRKNE